MLANTCLAQSSVNGDATTETERDLTDLSVRAHTPSSFRTLDWHPIKFTTTKNGAILVDIRTAAPCITGRRPAILQLLPL